MRNRTKLAASAAALFGLTLSLAAFGQVLLGGGPARSFEAYEPIVIGDYADPFRYDGEHVRPLEGRAVVDVDPILDEGTLIVEIRTTEESGPIVIAEGVELVGTLRIEFTEFVSAADFMQGGVAEYQLLHGDTGLMSDVMPEVFLDLVGWGTVDIYVAGRLFYQDLVGHFMLGDRVRRGPKDEYSILRSSDGVVYSPELESKRGFQFSKDKELHLFVANSMAGIESEMEQELALHVNLIVAEEPLAPSGGGGGSTPEDPVDDPEGPEKPDKQKGNNGIGNGEDPQPPGNPPINDGPGTSPGKGKSK